MAMLWYWRSTTVSEMNAKAILGDSLHISDNNLVQNVRGITGFYFEVPVPDTSEGQDHHT